MEPTEKNVHSPKNTISEQSPEQSPAQSPEHSSEQSPEQSPAQSPVNTQHECELDGSFLGQIPRGVKLPAMAPNTKQHPLYTDELVSNQYNNQYPSPIPCDRIALLIYKVDKLYQEKVEAGKTQLIVGCTVLGMLAMGIVGLSVLHSATGIYHNLRA